MALFDGRRAAVSAAAPLVTLCLVLLGAPAAIADLGKPLRNAGKALAAGDYQRAYREYLRHAEQKGNALAMFNLALFYDNGWGRPADPVKACQWHEKAAAGAIPYSSHRLAECLVEGIGRPADPGAAALWFRKAADLGHYISLCDLGDLYIDGAGVAKDVEKGLALCTEAAERNVAQAQLRVALLYLEGDESVRDEAQGAKWLEAAAHGGQPEAQYRLGALFLAHAANDAAAKNTARYWFEAAASQGYRRAYLPVAKLYLDVPPDPQGGQLPADALAKAYLWLSAASRTLGDPEALAEANGLLARVNAVMPESWNASLDAKVDAHLADHPSTP